MHAIQPARDYKLLNLTLAFDARWDDAEITDALNEFLNNRLVEADGDSLDEMVAVDWRFAEGPVVRASTNPQEGELFKDNA